MFNGSDVALGEMGPVDVLERKEVSQYQKDGSKMMSSELLIFAAFWSQSKSRLAL